MIDIFLMLLYIYFFLLTVDSKIGDSQIKVIGDLLKTNTTLNELNLSFTTERILLFILHICHYEANNIGDEGIKCISELLKVNTTINDLNLSSTFTFFFFFV